MQPIDLEQVLALRDYRARRQQALLAQYGQTLVCFGMNIPGPEKRTALIDRGFSEGKRRIEAVLQANALETRHAEFSQLPAGETGFWCVAADPIWLKGQMAALEDMDRLARLFDIDIFTPLGEKVTRSQLGLLGRRCFLCGRPAYECGRSRRHTVQQLQSYTQAVLEQFFMQQKAQTIGSAAVKALLYEAAVSPKPGLVDRLTSGANDDMDFFTFLDSSCALQPYFTACAQMGLTYARESGRQLLRRLRPLGAAAEQTMLQATGQVNTHKGAIFSLGILCAAAAAVSAEACTVSRLCSRAAEIGAASLEDYTQRPLTTGGARAFYEHQITGVRGEAAGGFAHVLAVGLPAFHEGLRAGKSLNDCGLDALLALLCQVEDTNAIKRTGRQQWQQQQTLLRRRLEGKPLGRQELLELDRLWTGLHLSPGGCADLLAVTYFLYFWDRQTEDRRCGEGKEQTDAV